MAPSVNDRLARLEEERAGVEAAEEERPCPECGITYGAEDTYEYEVAWDDIPEPKPPCPRCSLPRTIVIDWDVVPGTLREEETEEIDELEDQPLRKEIEWE